MKSFKEFTKSKKVTESVQITDRFNGGLYPIAEINAISERGSFGLNVTMQANSGLDPKGTIVWHVGYSANGPYNSGATTYKHVEEDEAADVMKKDYEEFKKVLKRCVEYCDREIKSALNKMGYKE
jgi:DNA-binding LytR/AlgR family response regulator